MQKLSSPESQFPAEGLFDETTVLDVEYFIKTLSGIIDKGVRPDLIGSIITHYASKWLPDLSSAAGNQDSSPAESPTNTWMKKRAFVEKLVGILPQEKDAVPCNFLLRLLRAANMVEAGLNYRDELEKRVACQLDQASLNELMIPSYNHTCETLLDVDLVIRIVRNYVGSGNGCGGGSLIKVAKLIDSYLAEVAVDSNLLLPDFISLAGALPEHSRSLNDGLYRAIDTYLKAHPSLSKEERKRLCRLLDSRKLSPEASLHATHNYRLPVRAIIQILLSEQTKLTRQMDWSGSFSGTRSPNMCQLEGPGPGRCQSKRESIAQQMEIKKLREDMLRLQKTCISIQAQMEKLLEKKKGSSSYFSHWKKLGSVAAVFRGRVEEGDGEREFGRRAPSDMKMKVAKPVRTPHKWRKSVS